MTGFIIGVIACAGFYGYLKVKEKKDNVSPCSRIFSWIERLIKQ
jgi:hypothetical protein